MGPLDSVKGTLRLSCSLLLYRLGRCWCLDHRLHPCFPISGRRACSLIFCLNHLTHRWLKRPLILDFSKSETSSCREGADIHLLKTVLECGPCPQPRGHRCFVRCWKHLVSVRLGWEGTRTALAGISLGLPGHLAPHPLQIQHPPAQGWRHEAAGPWLHLRITECFGLKGTFRGHLAQPACSEQGHLQLDQVAQSPIQPGLEYFQGWGIYHLSGKPIPVFHHPHCKKFLPSI